MDGSDVERGRAGTGRRTPRITSHAAQRWAERVGGSGSAIVALERFVAAAHRRPRPRHWTTAAPEPGTCFLYLADQPGVCVVLRGGAAVTVLTRALCRPAGRMNRVPLDRGRPYASDMAVDTTYQRGDKFLRIIKLFDLLQTTRQGRTTQEIADELAIDVRTTQRYIKQIADAGLEIERDDHNRYRVAEGSKLPPLQFTKPEGVAVLIALRLLQQMRTTRDASLIGAVGRLAQAVQIKTVTAYLGAMLEAVEGMPENDVRSQIENAVTQCFVDRLPCEIDYEDFSGNASRRVIRTYFLEPRPDTRTLYAYALDSKSQAMRWFRLDRIGQARPVALEGTYAVPEDFDIAAVTRSSWGVWQEDEEGLDEVVLRFASAVVPRVREAAWHPSTVLTELDDGGIEMRVQVASEIEMRPWVLGWGAHVEVLEPASLRECVAENMREGVRMYDTHLSSG